MRLRTTAILASAAFGLAIPASGLAGVSTTVGTGAKTCVLKPGADCRGVVHRWTAEHHGNLRKTKFTRSDLRGADFRGADLRGADFRGAKLRHADLRGAKLTGARFDSAKPMGKKAASGLMPGGPNTPPCWPNCAGADLSGANLSEGYLAGVNFTYANLSNAILTYAYFDGTNLSYANLSNANLSNAILISTNLPDPNLAGARPVRTVFTAAVWSNTICPNGTVTSTGC